MIPLSNSFRSYRIWILVAVLILVIGHFNKNNTGLDQLMAYNPNSLLEHGYFKGHWPLDTLEGDFGFGLLHNLEGLFVRHNNHTYHLHPDHHITTADTKVTTPFARISSFRPKRVLTLSEPISYATLEDVLAHHIGFKTGIYAIELKGHFQNLVLASFKPQGFPAAALSHQLETLPTITYPALNGYLIGFWASKDLHNGQTPSLNWLFINEHATIGGIVQDFSCPKGLLKIDPKKSSCLTWS